MSQVSHAPVYSRERKTQAIARTIRRERKKTGRINLLA